MRRSSLASSPERDGETTASRCIQPEVRVVTLTLKKTIPARFRFSPLIASRPPRFILRNSDPLSSGVALRADSRSSTTTARRPPAGWRFRANPFVCQTIKKRHARRIGGNFCNGRIFTICLLARMRLNEGEAGPRGLTARVGKKLRREPQFSGRRGDGLELELRVSLLFVSRGAEQNTRDENDRLPPQGRRRRHTVPEYW